MRNQHFLAVIGGFTSGIFFRSVFDFGIEASLFALFLGMSLFVYWFLVRFGSSASVVFLVSLFFIAGGFGMLRMDLKKSHPSAVAVLEHLGEKVKAEGVVIAEPDERSSTQRLAVRLHSLGGKNTDEKILVVADRFPAVSFGDRIAIAGTLEEPEVFETDSGRIFDYPSYLAKDDIRYQMSFARVEVISEGEGNPIVAGLLSLKRRFLEGVGRVIPEPGSSLLGGLLLGAKRSLGEDLEEEFRTAGLIHIVVLSGYNLTIIAEAVMKSLSFLPRFTALGAGAFSIVLFALMTGSSATVVRASIMALLVLLAQAIGRRYDISRALLLAAVFMLLHNPAILVFDPSFQLSFLATLGLIYGSPLLEERLRFVPEKFGLRQISAATLATQIVVLPLLLYQTGQFSLVSLPANLFVLPFIPLTMFLGFLAGCVALFSSILSLPFAFLAYLPLLYILFMSHFFASLPFASIAIPPLPFFVIIFWYVLYMVLFSVFWKRKQKTRPFAALSETVALSSAVRS